MDVNSSFEKTGIKCKVLQEIIQLAKKNCVEKVILFGSRARGDYKERSDIDLAFCGGSSSHFILDVDETTSTLLEFDIVDLDKPVRKELLESIKREGVVLYEKDWLQQSISQVKFFYGLFTGCINTIAGINCIYAGEGCWYFESEDKKYSLVIPNKEIKEVFKLQIQEWFRNKIFSNTDQLQDFWKAFKDGKESSYHKGENNYGKENFSSSGRTE